MEHIMQVQQLSASHKVPYFTVFFHGPSMHRLAEFLLPTVSQVNDLKTPSRNGFKLSTVGPSTVWTWDLRSEEYSRLDSQYLKTPSESTVWTFADKRMMKIGSIQTHFFPDSRRGDWASSFRPRLSTSPPGLGTRISRSGVRGPTRGP